MALSSSHDGLHPDGLAGLSFVIWFGGAETKSIFAVVAACSQLAQHFAASFSLAVAGVETRHKSNCKCRGDGVNGTADSGLGEWIVSTF